MELVWYTAASMDGKLATADHRLDFLDTLGAPPEEADDFPAFLRGIDGVVVGAETWRWLQRGGHGWPHADLPTWVVTHDPALVATLPVGAHPVSGPLDGLRAQLTAAGLRRVWVCGGGDVAGQLLAADALDEIVLTLAPTVVGAGPGWFGDHGPSAGAFSLVTCRRYGRDGVRLVWRRAR
jgi:riboflavin biosynthesis pyrimidine reductase